MYNELREEEIVNKVGGRFKLSTLIQKRMTALNRGGRPLVDLDTDDKMARLEALSITLCMECGCCSYVCPANRPLVQNNRLAKSAYRAYKAHQATLKK